MLQTQEERVAELEKELVIARKNLDKINPEFATKIAMGKSLGPNFDTMPEAREFRGTYQQLRTAKTFL